MKVTERGKLDISELRHKFKHGKPILVLDFDGTISKYSHGFSSDGEINDEPIPGAVDFVRQAIKVFDVQILSGRSGTQTGRDAMRRWFKAYGFPDGVKFPEHKPSAFVILDDRAVTFKGSYPDPKRLLQFKSWTGLEK